ncbi:hypothetical protein Taro_047266 [Colocasia esculenta]|uniref:Zinc finger CCCH domain-containing protein 25 n=1 Tax=Colocasia esculenta TaxID=4460 RepID=A0A843X0I2_COLES|nr:hypothetical protein [Colocasia esculenta]
MSINRTCEKKAIIACACDTPFDFSDQEALTPRFCSALALQGGGKSGGDDMNPLTQVKRIQKLNSVEASLGISDDASWHSKYKDSAYVFVGGIPFDLTEGDLLAVFAQCGEIVDVNLVRDKGTGKSKGFAFVAYEDQRSTVLAVDNLNGAKLLGRIIRVDHVSKYKKKEEEDEEERKRKREARGVCRAFQRGDCKRGDSCKFSHDEQRAANTGWGAQDGKTRWGHDMFGEPPSSRKSHRGDTTRGPEPKVGSLKSLPAERGDQSRTEGDDRRRKSSSSRVDHDDHRVSRGEPDKYKKGTASREDKDRHASERHSRSRRSEEGYDEKRETQKSTHSYS